MATTTIITDAKEAFTLLDQSLIWQPNLSRNDPIRPPIFMSLEVVGSNKSISQLGISIFDPCWLASRNHDRKISNKGPIMTALYLGTTRHRPRHQQDILIVGNNRRLRRTALRQQLMRALAPTECDGRPRDVVIVCHDLKYNLGAIKYVLAIDVRNLATVRAALDTRIFLKYVLTSTPPQSLTALLNALNMRHGSLNHAGHDTRCALRTFFFTYCHLKRGHMESVELLEHLSQVEEVAKFYEPREKLIWNRAEMRYEIQDAVMIYKAPSEGKRRTTSDLF